MKSKENICWNCRYRTVCPHKVRAIKACPYWKLDELVKGGKK